MKETELKFFVDSHDAVRNFLIQKNGELKRESDETAVYFDDAQRSLDTSGRTLRIKYIGDQTLLTFKGPASDSSRFRERDEYEVVMIGEDVERILKGLGFQEFFRYSKHREHWQLSDAHIELDTCMGHKVIEIEAAPAIIERYAEEIGLDIDEGSTETYTTLVKKWRHEQSG